MGDVELYDGLLTTRAMRRFTDEPVTDDEIIRILAAAVQAPSGGNIQPYQFVVVTEPVRDTDTAGDLLGRLSRSGAELLVATLDGIEAGQLTARPQPADGISYAPKLGQADARVDWKLAADGTIGLPPGPGLGVEIDEKLVEAAAKKPQTYRWPGAHLRDGSVADY